MTASPATPRERGARVRRPRRWLAGLALLLGVIVVAMLGGREAGGAVARLVAGVGEAGTWAPAAFVVVYAVATVALIPGSILTLVGGALFGIAAGTAYVMVGATLGASAAFLIARYVARTSVERRVSRDPRFAAIDRAVGEDGRRIVFLLRLSPVVPFNLLNYALGLTRVRYLDFLVASLGMLPGTLLYTYSGRLVGDVAALAAGAEAERGAGHWLVLMLGLAATAAAAVLVTRRARQALREAAE